MPKMYPILERFPDIAMAYYKSLNCFVELLVCNNEVSFLHPQKKHLKILSLAENSKKILLNNSL